MGLNTHNGFGWRALVNYYKDSALSSLTPFSSTTRNALVTVPGVSMTIADTGVYLIIYKLNGYNNSTYSPGSGNADDDGIVYFILNGGSLQTKSFLIQRNSYDGFANSVSFVSNAVEYSTVQSLNAGDKLKLEVESTR